jgi:hypothetical protein
MIKGIYPSYRYLYGKMKKHIPTQFGNCRHGIFKPTNPQKYVGDPNQIFFRSNLERRYMNFFDTQPAVTHWGAEEIFVQYVTLADPIQDNGTRKVRRYIPDFVIRTIGTDKINRVFMVEIKPKSHCIAPKIPKSSNSKRYAKDFLRYQINKDKWTAATEFCENRGMKFVVLTEDHLKHGW